MHSNCRMEKMRYLIYIKITSFLKEPKGNYHTLPANGIVRYPIIIKTLARELLVLSQVPQMEGTTELRDTAIPSHSARTSPITIYCLCSEFTGFCVLAAASKPVSPIDRLNSIVRLVSAASIGITTIRTENPVRGICGIALLSFTYADIR